MSYILDALKKSEQERQRGDLPSLQTSHAATHAKSASSSWKAKLTAVVVALNVLFFVFWLGRYGFSFSTDNSPAVRSASEAVKNAEGSNTTAAREPNYSSTSTSTNSITNGVVQNNLAESVSTTASANVAIQAQNQAQVQAISSRRSGLLSAADVAPMEAAQKARSLSHQQSFDAMTEEQSSEYATSDEELDSDDFYGSEEDESDEDLSQYEAIEPHAKSKFEKKREAQPENSSLYDEVDNEELFGQEILDAQAAAHLEKELVNEETSTTHEAAINIAKLPSNIREKIPPLEFSSHMYSTIPKFRNVIINGLSLKEQQPLNRELFLEQITEEGVILSFQGYRFEVGVIQQWNF